MQTRLFVVGCILLAAQAAFGQTFGSIDGETRDSSGAIVDGATVTVVNTGTNAVRTVTTNGAGEYSFPSLQPGIYTVKVEKSGFKTVVRNQIELQVQHGCPHRFRVADRPGELNRSKCKAMRPCWSPTMQRSAP